jgi:hypothetical protein
MQILNDCIFEILFEFLKILKKANEKKSNNFDICEPTSYAELVKYKMIPDFEDGSHKI